MALSEIEEHHIVQVVSGFLKSRRPPAHLRDQVDLLYAIQDQSVVLLERRRLMNGEVIERPFAKATWVKSTRLWKVYWQRADLHWHSYEPAATVPNIEAFCELVGADPIGCFWG